MAKLICGCDRAVGCWHGPLIPGRILSHGDVQIVENISGKIRLVSVRELLCYPDGSITMRKT